MLDRIPYEIFSKIIKTSYKRFSFISVLFDAEETILPPINATHVCRSWRTALLSDPTMWTYIKLKFIKGISGQVKEMLSRSGSAPLDVSIGEVGYLFEASAFNDLISILPHLFREMHRFQKLHILIPTIIARVSFHLLKQPAPILQKFHLEMRELSGRDSREWATLQEVYRDLFLGNAPNLKHAHLQISAGLKELQSGSLFKNMSRLYLDFVSGAVINADILLGILQSSPCLRILNVNIAWSYSGPIIIHSIPSNHRIPLPYLQKLTLRRCDVNIVNFILGRLDFPFDKVDFDITCNDSHLNISNSTLLLHFLSQRRLSLLSISPSISAEMSFEFFENIDLGSPTFGFHSMGSSVFRIPYNYDMPHMPLDALSNLLRKFDMSDITHMFLEMIPPESAILRRIFPLLENLQHLRIHHRHWDELDNPLISRLYLEVLVSRLQVSNPQTQFTQAGSESEIVDLGPKHEAGQGNVFPCPSLHTLELVLSHSAEKSVELHFHEFVQCCKIQEQAGYPFKSISIFCDSATLAETVKIWLQANELECSHVEVRIITW